MIRPPGWGPAPSPDVRAQHAEDHPCVEPRGGFGRGRAFGQWLCRRYCGGPIVAVRCDADLCTGGLPERDEWCAVDGNGMAVPVGGLHRHRSLAGRVLAFVEDRIPQLLDPTTEGVWGDRLSVELQLMVLLEIHDTLTQADDDEPFRARWANAVGQIFGTGSRAVSDISEPDRFYPALAVIASAFGARM